MQDWNEQDASASLRVLWIIMLGLSVLGLVFNAYLSEPSPKNSLSGIPAVHDSPSPVGVGGKR